jgi:hypothetical protein
LLSRRGLETARILKQNRTVDQAAFRSFCRQGFKERAAVGRFSWIPFSLTQFSVSADIQYLQAALKPQGATPLVAVKQ